MRGVAGRDPMIRPWPNRRTPFGSANIWERSRRNSSTCSDYREIVSRAGLGHVSPVPIAAQFVQPCSD